jgi:hypothetical protein
MDDHAYKFRRLEPRKSYRFGRKAASTSYNPKRFQISRASIAAKTSAAKFSVKAESKPPLDQSAIPNRRRQKGRWAPTGRSRTRSPNRALTISVKAS